MSDTPEEPEESQQASDEKLWENKIPWARELYIPKELRWDVKILAAWWVGELILPTTPSVDPTHLDYEVSLSTPTLAKLRCTRLEEDVRTQRNFGINVLLLRIASIPRATTPEQARDRLQAFKLSYTTWTTYGAGIEMHPKLARWETTLPPETLARLLVEANLPTTNLPPNDLRNTPTLLLTGLITHDTQPTPTTLDTLYISNLIYKAKQPGPFQNLVRTAIPSMAPYLNRETNAYLPPLRDLKLCR